MTEHTMGDRNGKTWKLAASALGLVLLACGGLWLLNDITARLEPMYPHWDCLGVSANDIVGTWRAQDIMRDDTLMLRADGGYRQIIHIQHADKSNVDFDSGWQSWTLEKSAQGSYLHLQQMNLCAAFQGLNDCENAAGVDIRWGDFCAVNYGGQPKPAEPGEGIMVVLRTPGIPLLSHGLELKLLYEQEYPWVYELQTP